MSRGKKIGMILMAAATVSMYGCGSTFPNMTEDQQVQVVEYASGLLLRYDENYQSKLVKEEEPSIAEEAEEQEAVQVQEALPETVKAEAKVVEAAPAALPEYNNVEEFYEISGISTSFTGYEVKDMYPEAGEDEIFLAMEASTGNKLLVLKFDVKNVSGSEMQLDMPAYDTKFKIGVNDKAPKYALTTMLPDDLSFYKGSMQADEVMSMVLITEIPEEEASQISTISLSAKKGAEDAVIVLQ